MNVMNIRTWIVFYVFCFVAMFVSVDFLYQGMWKWVRMGLFNLVLCCNFLLMISEIKYFGERKKMMKNYSPREKLQEDMDE